MSGDLTKNLGSVLAVEERVYRDLRELFAKERECMLELDAEALYELATRKEVLAEEGSLARDARRVAMDKLAKSLDLSEPLSTLGDLCDAMGSAADPIREAQSRLAAVVSAVAELSEANQRLGGERLSDVQSTLELLGRLAPARPRELARQGGSLVRRTA